MSRHPATDTNGNQLAAYRLVKKYKTSSTAQDQSHVQIFHSISGTSPGPMYYRELLGVEGSNMYWYNAALVAIPEDYKKEYKERENKGEETETGSNSITLPPVELADVIWDIEPIKLRYTTFFKKPKKPKDFRLTYLATGSGSDFSSMSRKESSLGGYVGEVTVPFDKTTVQRYWWIPTSSSKWTFTARNDPTTPLAEISATSDADEFDIVFLRSHPPGWSPKMAERLSRYSGLSGGSASGFQPVSETVKANGVRESIVSYIGSGRDFTVNEDSGSKYWQEYVLASTVVVLREVNKEKKGL
ncbi:11303_t:CDS:2 [Paraglomus occultum]|uniref:11303_t:CDS:1 n=1 Tax=Paraglomus occultum TaxID=144539 RepID=A0A9N8W308_9GLOM|nr:11303_t:CDS:2 [Paraglomus occultum]